jgi:hypothetical protein
MSSISRIHRSGQMCRRRWRQASSSLDVVSALNLSGQLTHLALLRLTM